MTLLIKKTLTIMLIHGMFWGSEWEFGSEKAADKK